MFWMRFRTRNSRCTPSITSLQTFPLAVVSISLRPWVLSGFTRWHLPLLIVFDRKSVSFCSPWEPGRIRVCEPPEKEHLKAGFEPLDHREFLLCCMAMAEREACAVKETPGRAMKADMLLEGVLEDLKNHVKEHGDMKDEHLRLLYVLCDKTLEHALVLVDQGGVQAFVAERTGRTVYHVHSERNRKSGQETYVCFPKHYCSCYAFFYDVVGRGEHICCKHQLAARIAHATNQCGQTTVTDEELARLLLRQ